MYQQTSVYINSSCHLTDTKLYLDSITDWTNSKLMKLNPSKSSQRVFSQSQEEFSTLLALNSKILEQKTVSKILGVSIEEDAGCWQKAANYLTVRFQCLPNWSMLKSTASLLDLELNIAHLSSHVQEQSQKIENIQKTSLRIILHDEYDNYKSVPTRTDVSFANGTKYKNSAIIVCQKQLNKFDHEQYIHLSQTGVLIDQAAACF